MIKKLKHLTQKSRANLIIAVAAATIVLVAGVVYIGTQAAGFFASSAPEKGQLAGAAKVGTDAAAVGGEYVAFGTDQQTPPPNTGGMWLPKADRPLAFH